MAVKKKAKVKRKVVKVAAKVGRPKKQVDLPRLKDLASIGCTVEEICTLMHLSKPTFYERMKDNEEFSNAYNLGCADIKESLRRMQLAACKRGNTGMLIWLGKQILGQRDIQPPKVVQEDQTQWQGRVSFSGDNYAVVKFGNSVIDAYQEHVN